MEVSPLTQQERPSSFQPKIAQLYEDLFQQDDQDLVDFDGFWREFFLLRPDRTRLQQKLEQLHPNELLHLQHESQQLFLQAVSYIKAGERPMDENALDTLIVFLSVILAKRYTNPSADIIAVTTGLDEVDTVFNDFANAIENLIRSGRTERLRQRAIDAALALTCGAYQTSLISYFTHRDLFPAVMKFVQTTEENTSISRAFLLLGLLCNYNKFEFRNPYRVRLEDFVNEGNIQRLVKAFGAAMVESRNHYVAIQDDMVEGWTVSNTLTSIGLRVLAPTKSTPQTKPENLNGDFGNLPDSNVTVLLGVYEFSSANKVFCYNLITCPGDSNNAESPISAYLSFTSYLLHHAYRSQRAGTYGILCLLVLRIIIEDLGLCKELCNIENTTIVRLCRQRQPFLPAISKPRPSITVVLDIIIDTINHNLRRHLDLHLYISTVGLLHRIMSYLALTRTRIIYHWSILWQSLTSFLRFLITYAPSFMKGDPDLPQLLKPLLATLALGVASGESFLPDPAAYDDLFYKLVEAGDYLTRFKQVFADQLGHHSNTNGSYAPMVPNGRTTAPIDLLIQVSGHYHRLVQEERSKGRLGNNPSPREVGKIIRGGYESLSLPAMEGLDLWNRFREGEERGLLKRAARLAVEDTKRCSRVAS